MIFKRRFNATFLVILLSTFVSSEQRGDEFNLKADELQVINSDASGVNAKPSRYLYNKEMAHCPVSESKMMLTILLKSKKWSDVEEKKREKAIKKMSRFFLVPMDFIKLDDIHTTEMLEMLKHSINKSNNLLNTKETVGRIEFPIGCGDKLFLHMKTVAHKINDYVKSGKLQELTGLQINWWNVWSKHLKSRVQRTRREADTQGSGGSEVEEYEEYEEDEDLDDEDDENNLDQFSEPEQNNERKTFKPKKKGTHDEITTPIAPAKHSNLPILANHGTDNEGNIDSNNANEHLRPIVESDYQTSSEDPAAPLEGGGEESEIKEEMSLPDPIGDIEEITQRTGDSAPTPIGTNEILKLENDVAKTIENDNNVGDVPPLPKQQDDKILEEWAQNVFPRPTSGGGVTPGIETTSGTSAYSYETIVEENHQEIKISTTDLEENLRETVGITSTTMSTTLSDSETIFSVINHSAQNEYNLNEKLPIVTSTTIESYLTTLTEQEPILTLENITERIMPTTSSSYPSLSHETTSDYPLMTNPTLTTTLPAEITTIISASLEPSITDTTTSTLRNVDATIALVATVDKVRASTTSTGLTEKKSEEESNYDDEYDDEDDLNSVVPVLTEKATSPSSGSTQSATTLEQRTPPPLKVTPQEEDDEDDDADEIDDSVIQRWSSMQPHLTTPVAITTTVIASTIPSTTAGYEVTSEAVEIDPITEDYEEYDNVNNKPYVAKRMKKLQATAGKTFTYKLEDSIFEDEEDKKNLVIQLLDKNGQPLPSNSWIRFDADKQEIYGLPLENDVSKHDFKLRATDSGNEYVDEIVDITVHQHKTLRSVNHEIYIQVTVEKEFNSTIDWEIRLIRGIVEALDDDSIGSIVVRDVKPNKHQKNFYTFVYSNDTLPKDRCPKDELNNLMLRLTKKALSDALGREITVRNVEKDLINACAEINTPRPPPIKQNPNNFPPTVRNAIDKINAYAGQLLVYPVPKDTFYDPEDLTDLKLTLLNEDRSPIDPTNWLQFDVKNKEFYGVPTEFDRTQNYVLVAEDKNGLTTNDALVVDVSKAHLRRDYSATIEYQLEINIDQFQNPSMKRKFIERLQNYFDDLTTDNIVVKSVKKVKYAGRTAVTVQNTTLLYREACSHFDILSLKNRLVMQDGSVRDDVKQAIGSEFNVQKITVAPAGKCASSETHVHRDLDLPPVDRPDEKETPIINQEVLITYVLPTAIILLMLLIALLIACLLYKRRNTGKMELGDEEERKSFRSKGIPVIFQDELDEKPEVLTKSPVILKDEKPPLLPQYNGMSQEGEDMNVDEYIPPQPLLMGNRELRGKSPLTPSYRKPPPYVSP